MTGVTRKILVVDDASPVVLCVNVLQAPGYVVEANSGAAAVDVLRKERFDMSFTGFEVVTQARALHPDLPLGELAQEAR